MKKLLAFSVVLVFVATASADMVDDFDSYADQAAFEGTWTPQYAGSSMDLDQTFGYSDGQSVHGVVETNYTKRNYLNLGAEYAGTDAQPLVFEFMMNFDESQSTAPWNARNYVALYGYSGAGYNDGDLEGIIALGLYNSGDSTVYQSRVIFGGSSWFDTTATRVANEWKKLTAVITTGLVEIYVDDVYAGESTRSPGFTYDSIVIGSGLTSADVDAWYDDIAIYNIPEPGTLILLGLGGLALIRRR